MTTLSSYIVPRYKSEDSLVLRYSRFTRSARLTQKDLMCAHIREGARILKFFDYKGVSIYMADESTFMAGGNYKTLEACFITAYCKKDKDRRVAFSSGANLGSGLTLYGRKAGIETFFFQPAEAVWKLDAGLFQASSSHLIAVDKPEKEVKMAAVLFAQMAGIRHVPRIQWRYLATGTRALFVFEYILKNNLHFDWITQAVCAGYGPIGFYDCVQELMRKRIVNRRLVPKFLGIQQEGLMPMVRAWQNRHGYITAADRVIGRRNILSPSLYNTSPDQSYPRLYRHLMRFGGDLIPLTRAEYDKYLPLVLEELSKKNIKIARRKIDSEARILENAGIIGLAGCLKAIDKKIIEKGGTVLSFFTGGAGSFSRKMPVPEFKIRRTDDLKTALKHYRKSLLY